jgi:Ni,Fe-hydrogenase I cytochrome b subunit
MIDTIFRFYLLFIAEDAAPKESSYWTQRFRIARHWGGHDCTLKTYVLITQITLTEVVIISALRIG